MRKVSRAPRRLSGSRHRSKIMKKVFQIWLFSDLSPQIGLCIKSIFGWDSVSGPTRELTTLIPQTPYSLALAMSPPLGSRSRHLQNESVIGPRENGFLGPTVALGEPCLFA